MKTSNPNAQNIVFNLNQSISSKMETGRKSNAKKYKTKSKVNGNNGNSLLKDDYFGF